MALATTTELHRELRRPTCLAFWGKLQLWEDNAQTELVTTGRFDFNTYCRNIQVLEEPSGLPPAREWDHGIELEGGQKPNLPLF